MKYQIQYRNRRYKDKIKRSWENPWIDYDEDTVTIFGPTEITVKSDDLDIMRMSMATLHDHSQGMVDHRLISVVDETSAVFKPSF